MKETCPKTGCDWTSKRIKREDRTKVVDQHVRTKHKSLWREHVSNLRKAR